MNPHQQVGENIKTARIKLGLSQERLAAKLQVEGCDISRGILAKIELGQRELKAVEVTAFIKVLKIDHATLLASQDGQ